MANTHSGNALSCAVQAGVSGFNYAGDRYKLNPQHDPNLYVEEYDCNNANADGAFRLLAPSSIARLYHSSTTLEVNGDILVGGCSSCVG